jgi:hypothetical protein
MLNAGLKVEGLTVLARRARSTSQGALLGDLAKVMRKAEQTTLTRQKLRAAASGRPQDSAVAELLKGSTKAGNATVSARGPFVAGAAWGAQHDKQRETKRGPRQGWNQFARPRGGSSWFWCGARDAATELEDDIAKEVDRLIRGMI